LSAEVANLRIVPIDETTDEGLARIQNEMILLFRRARVYFQSSAQVAHPELQSAAYALLAYLVDGGSMRASALVDHFGTDKGAISRQLGQLETLGLVHRLPDPADGRAQLVEATELGAERCAEARRHSRQRMHDQLDSWDIDDIQQLGALLAKLNKALGEPQK
jgi:DNA-binding MarR family transcriptional regulator